MNASFYIKICCALVCLVILGGALGLSPSAERVTSYTVTMESWPWRYNVTSITASSDNTRGTKTTDSITVTLGMNGEVTFTVARNNNWWLDGNSPRGN